MKKRVSSVRFSLLAIGVVIFLGLSFSACKKNLDVDNTPTPVAGLMAFNLVPDKGAINVALSGNSLAHSPLDYTGYTGTYLPIYPGSREVASYEYNSSTPFATTTQNFEVNKYYSVFTVGAGGTYRNVVVNDAVDSLPDSTGKAFVRYINAIPDSSKPVVTISGSGKDIESNSASFGSVSNFSALDTGEVTLKVSNGTTISAIRTITLEKGKVYTVLLVGVPGSSDPAKLVAIRYVTNGMVD
jgi:hypothetical protein